MKELGVHVGHDIGARMLVQVTTILLRRDPLVKVRVWSLELVNGHQMAQISVYTENIHGILYKKNVHTLACNGALAPPG